MAINWKVQPNYKVFVNPNRWLGLPFNFYILLGGRGIGKTTAFKYASITNAIKKGEEFVYIRRYKPECKLSRDLFGEIIDGVTTKGTGVDGCYMYMYDKRRIGYCVPLSIQQSLKSGVDFSKVSLIIYDEAIIERKNQVRYLPNEMHSLLEFISTVVRNRTNYKVFIMGNNLDLFNPYMDYFKIPEFESIYKDKKRKLYVEKCENKEELVDIQEQTPLYALTNGTQYGEYHYANKTLVANKAIVGEKDSKAQFAYRIEYFNYCINVYSYEKYVKNEGTKVFLYISSNTQTVSDYQTWHFTIDSRRNFNEVKLFRSSNHYRLLNFCYYNKQIVFDNDGTSSMILQILEECK